MSGLKMTSKEFHRITKRDFENGAVRNEISNALKDREALLAESKQLQAELHTAKAEIKRKNIAINIAIHLICSDDDYGGDNMIRGIERLEQALEGD